MFFQNKSRAQSQLKQITAQLKKASVSLHVDKLPALSRLPPACRTAFSLPGCSPDGRFLPFLLPWRISNRTTYWNTCKTPDIRLAKISRFGFFDYMCCGLHQWCFPYPRRWDGCMLSALTGLGTCSQLLCLAYRQISPLLYLHIAKLSSPFSKNVDVSPSVRYDIPESEVSNHEFFGTA